MYGFPGIAASRLSPGYAVPTRPGLRADICPALLLALHDLDHARIDVTDAAEHVVPRELLALHRVLAGQDLDAGRIRFVDAVGDRRVELEHADARAIRHDLDVDVRRAEVRLDVAGVVEREVPFGLVAVAHLDHDLAALRGRLRLRVFAAAGKKQDRRNRGEPAAQDFSDHETSVAGPAPLGAGRCGALCAFRVKSRLA